MTVLGLDVLAVGRESEVLVECRELLDEWNEPEADDEDRWVYVDQGQCGRESGEGRLGELEMEMGRPTVRICRVRGDLSPVSIPSSRLLGATMQPLRRDAL